MRLAAKVEDTLLLEIQRTCESSKVEATSAQIMSWPDTEVEAWVSRNENLLHKIKKIWSNELYVSSLLWQFDIGRGGNNCMSMYL